VVERLCDNGHFSGRFFFQGIPDSFWIARAKKLKTNPLSAHSRDRPEDAGFIEVTACGGHPVTAKHTKKQIPQKRLSIL
jgi:hypothetical protein